MAGRNQCFRRSGGGRNCLCNREDEPQREPLCYRPDAVTSTSHHADIESGKQSHRDCF
jgi:hypothetical protein